MGSSFGKVRKYNLNHVGESGKYSSLSEENNASGLTSLTTRSRPSTPGGASSLRSHVPADPEVINEPFKDAGRSEQILLNGDGTFHLPHLFRFHVNEDFVKEYAYQADHARAYKYPKEPVQTSPSLNEVTQPPAPPVPPRNLKPGMVSGRSESYFDPNPRPPQKEYSAEDINHILRPLNKMNSKVLKEADKNPTFQNAPRYEELDPSHYCTLHYPPEYIPSCTCGNSRIQQHQWQSSMIPQQTYSYRQEVPRPPTHYRYHTIHNPQPYRYSLPYNQVIPNLHPNPRQVKVQPEMGNNAVALDKVMRPEHHPASKVETPQQPGTSSYYKQDSNRSMQPSPIDQGYGVNLPKARNEIRQETHRNHDRFSQTGVLSQQAFNADGFGNVDHRHIHTIPEETSWPPPFHYDPSLRHVHPTGFRY